MPESSNIFIETLENIVDWSNDRPIWQRDALRRLVQKGTLDQADLDELLAICRQQHMRVQEGEDKTDSEAVEPSHFPSSGLDSAAVVLTSIKDVENANALAPGKTLPFASEGITVIYGDNASGKSGYARILKRACRARASGSQILPNVYEPPTSTPASATIEFTVDGDEDTETWTDGTPSSELLSNISVFDSDCASVQVHDSNEVSFTPYGLDLLGALAEACQELKSKLQAEKSALEASQSAAIINHELTPKTSAGKIIEGLSKDTDYNAVARIAELSSDEAKRLADLQTALADNPLAKIPELESRIERTIRARSELSEIHDALSDAEVTKATQLYSEAEAKSEAARVAAEQLFGGEGLPEVGSSVWKTLWESARKYSEEHAYEGRAFPVVDADALCVLCQQPIDEETASRLTNFEKFVTDDTQEVAKVAERELSETQTAIHDLRIPYSRKVTADIGVTDDELEVVRKAIVSYKARRRTLLRQLSGQNANPIVDQPASLSPQLDRLIEDVRGQINLQREAANADQRQKLIDELNELQDRRKLNGLLSQVESEIERLQKIAAVEECLSDVETNRITRKSTEIARTVLTPQLRDRFAEEISRLRTRSARVELVHSGGSYGAQKYQIRLLAAPDTAPDVVLSEGEHTCVALAGHLAELAGYDEQSGIVFDDPVSSLDHRWRRHVAERLVDEASKRQVIVFTHDAVFLMNIMEATARLGVECDITHLMRQDGAFGIPEAGAPWIAMRIKDRIGYLKKKLQEAEAVHNRGEHAAYDPLARTLYRLLRQAWERAVEEILLNGVVLRFGREVQTNRLRHLTDISDDDIRLINQEMSKCSTYFGGHDESAAINEEAPSPDEIKDDIATLEDWVSQMRKRGRS